MDSKEIVDNLRNEIKELSLKNEELSNLLESQEAKFRSDMKSQIDLHAVDVFALQKCKEKLKVEKTKNNDLEKSLEILEKENSENKIFANSIDLEVKKYQENQKTQEMKYSEMEMELSNKKKECEELNEKIDVMHKAFVKLNSEVKAKEAATRTLSTTQRLKIEENVRFDAYEDDSKKTFQNMQYDSVKQNCDIKVENRQVMPVQERKMYETKINFLQQALNKYEKYCIGVPKNDTKNSQKDSERKLSEKFQDLANENFMLNALVQRQTREKVDSTEKLFAASKQIQELIGKNTTSKMEIESSNFKLTTVTDDLSHERKKIKRLEGVINEKNSWIEREQNKKQELKKLLQKKDRKIVELTKNCNSLETDVTQLMNELRKLEAVAGS